MIIADIAKAEAAGVIPATIFMPKLFFFFSVSIFTIAIK